LNIDVSKTGHLTVISVEGNLLREASEEFEIKVEAVIKGGEKKIVLDLEKCSFISSLNLSVMLWAKKQLVGSGGDVKITGVGRVMADLLKRTSLDQLFEIHDSVEDAAKAFGVEG
jgi:anti-sigma B factor antagonist